MKVKALSRSADDVIRARPTELHRVHRNLDPALHPFERAKEYTRAVQAAKVERMFAKPFVAALTGHIDGVYCMAKHPRQLETLFSGSGDGELRIWSLSTRETIWVAPKAHRGIVKGICPVPYSTGDRFLSVGTDKLVKIWKQTRTAAPQPVATFVSNDIISAVDHHRKDPMFATCGSRIDIWDVNRSQPISSLSWGVDTINTVRFNQTETHVLASCGTDRTIMLYDMRTNSPLTKVVLTMKTNAIAWNPMEAYNFAAANEDHNIYSFDMRRLDRALCVHKDHVSAVLDVDFSPTGEEFVSGSYDRSLRIFKRDGGHSREVYHTKRMQHLFCVKFSMDAKYVLSGSDDGNVRVWKANASEKLGALSSREKAHMEYNDKLKDRFKHMPEVRRITKHRHVPKSISKAASTKRTMINSQKAREENKRKHSKPGSVPYVPERNKNIILTTSK
ncbi:WD repeats and SOF1 domain containing-like protein [Ramicandelaber brevisporus]|nr:WD repeats and SOF1 domain containing-like protein [Ramicandelaber brevisporus]